MAKELEPKALGPTFGDEIIAAGLGGASFSWGQTDDKITGREALNPEQNATLDATIAAHDATRTPAPYKISDRQFYQAQAQAGLITQDEALAAVSVGTIPPNVMAGVVAGRTEEEQFAAKMQLTGALVFDRSDPLIEQIFVVSYGMDKIKLYDFWARAAAL